MDRGIEKNNQEINSKDKVHTRRFVLPVEKQLRKRLDTLKTTFKALQLSHPEMIGLTLYGSMVAGGAKATSDIDGFVYLEEQETVKHLTEDDYRFAEEESEQYEKSKPTWSTSGGVNKLDLAASHRYLPFVFEALRAQGLTEEQIKHLRIRVISDKIVKDELKKAIESERGFIKYNEDRVSWNKKLDKLPFDQWDPWEDKPKYPPRHNVDWKIAAMFHLQIGSGLDHYRTQIVKQLKEEGEIGERVWKQLIGYTADMEHHLRGSNYPNLYPVTLGQAADYYQLPKS